MRYTLILSVLLSQAAFCQGWQQLGPDSVNWREAYYLTGRWTSGSSFDLAASTSQGVAIYSSAGTWNYRLRHIPESIVNNGVSYAFLEFSPWEANACFVGHYIAYTEADLHVTKTTFPPPFPPVGGGAHGPCWLGPLSLVAPPNNTSEVFAGVCGVQKSTDRGVTWQSVLAESVWGSSRLVGVNLSDSHTLYRVAEMGENKGVLYRSTNSGATWDSIFSHLFTSGYYSRGTNVVATGDTILVGTYSYPYDTSSTGAIARSLDGGATWSITFSEGHVGGLAVVPLSRRVFAAGTRGIIQSTDWGLTWTPFNNALPTTAITGLVVNPTADTAFVPTTTHGVLKVWRFGSGVNMTQSEQPVKFLLLQNYPNPFNPKTGIKFDVPSSKFVSLKVYDLLGREVATLVDEVKTPGEFSVTWDASGVASGIYFYRLVSGGFVQTRKMVLAK